MRYQFIKPSPFLAPYIKHYWFMESDLEEGDIVERVVPTANVQLMFHYKRPFMVNYQDASISEQQPQSIVSGLSGTYFDVSTQGASGVITVVFNPSGACNFFCFPLNKIENQSIHLADLFTGETSEIEDRICECGTLIQRVAVIEQFLISKFNPIPQQDQKMIRNSIFLIHQSRGQIQSNQLAEKLCLSPKSMERKFAMFVGKTPKQFIKTIRFNEVMLGLAQGKETCLTEYAYNNGYFDQSHFIKVFKAYSGYTPKEFIKQCPCKADWLESEFK
jgi:AraC-like DNA-binding protein